MKIEFTPLTHDLIPPCRAFNERLRERGSPPFTLPEKLSTTDSLNPGEISSTHYVAVDGSGAVRGGMLLMEQRGWLLQRVIRLINIQSPISEGLVDRRFFGLSLQLLKFVNDRSPYSFAVGMGNEQQPFPRVLRAAGWMVQPVPFAFAVTQPRSFLCEIGPLRTGPRRWLARGAASSGLGSLALSAWRLAHRDPAILKLYSLELAQFWPQGTESVWQQCRAQLVFSSMRDESALAALYPDGQPRLKRFLLRSDGKVAGWSVGIVTKMTNDPNFGNLVVGTILDGLTANEHLSALLSLTRNALAELGAEVILTNQMHVSWRAELRRLGFFGHSSNYLVAMSKRLASALGSEPRALDRAHVNRGDGDGRIHL